MTPDVLPRRAGLFRLRPLSHIGADGVGDERVYVIEQTLGDSVSHVAQSNESEFYLICPKSFSYCIGSVGRA